MKLRTKFLIVLVAITLVLSLATYGGLELYKRQQVSQTQESVNETAELAAGQIDTSIAEHKDNVARVAERPAADNFNRSGEYVDAFLDNTQFWAAEVIATNGTVVAFRGDVTEEARRDALASDRSGESYFEQPLQTNEQSFMSDPVYSEIRDKFLVRISAPIIVGEEIKGVFAAAIWVDQTTFFRATIPLERNTQVVTVSHENATLHPTQTAFEQTITGSATVDSSGWTVEITRDASGLTSDLQTLAIAQGAGLVIVLLFVAAFGYWQYATNLRQTERLLEAFGKLEEGDYEYSVSLGSGEEWVQIGEGYNQLSLGLKRREERLRERQQRLEVLYRVLRHNLRNEMSIVQNYADIIKDMSSEEPIRDAAGTILDAGEDLIGLSEKARQIENALQEASTDPTTLDAADAVRDVVADIRETYPEVDIRTSIPDTAWVSAIPSLAMAIENVCENACKHNDADDPVVEVSVTERPSAAAASAEAAIAADGGTADRVAIEVADNGSGIPEQDRNVLRQGRETALEHGSGLGLWLVYWIVDKSGGDLGFDENEPRGSIVTIELDGAAEPPDPDDA